MPDKAAFIKPYETKQTTYRVELVYRDPDTGEIFPQGFVLCESEYQAVARKILMTFSPAMALRMKLEAERSHYPASSRQRMARSVRDGMCLRLTEQVKVTRTTWEPLRYR